MPFLAPPVGSAKDPVNIAGMAAQNVLDGIVEQIDWKELSMVASLPNVIVLDVRNASEVVKNGALIEGALNIPLNDLRSKMDEIPSDVKRVVVSCASGQVCPCLCYPFKSSFGTSQYDAIN